MNMCNKRDKGREFITELPLNVPCGQPIRQLSAIVQLSKALFISKKLDYVNTKGEVQFNQAVLIAESSENLMAALTRPDESLEERRKNVKEALEPLCQHNEGNQLKNVKAKLQ